MIDFGSRDAFACGCRSGCRARCRDGAGTVGIDVTSTVSTIAGERFVDGVIDDLIHHMVQTGAVVGVADIHARPFAHRIQALQDLDGLCASSSDKSVLRAASAMNMISKSI